MINGTMELSSIYEGTNLNEDDRKKIVLRSIQYYTSKKEKFLFVPNIIGDFIQIGAIVKTKINIEEEINDYLNYMHIDAKLQKEL